MRYLIYTLFFVFITPCFTALSQEKTPCNSEEYLDSCRKHIEDDHFTDIKEFFIKNEKGNQKQIEHSFTFTAGTTYEYYFTGYQEGKQQIIASLLNDKKKKLVSSHEKDQYAHKITYFCKKTGVYYIRFNFEDDEEFCGAAVLGFTKTKKKK